MREDDDLPPSPLPRGRARGRRRGRVHRLHRIVDDDEAERALGSVARGMNRLSASAWSSPWLMTPSAAPSTPSTVTSSATRRCVALRPSAGCSSSATLLWSRSCSQMARGLVGDRRESLVARSACRFLEPVLRLLEILHWFLRAGQLLRRRPATCALVEPQEPIGPRGASARARRSRRALSSRRPGASESAQVLRECRTVSARWPACHASQASSASRRRGCSPSRCGRTAMRRGQQAFSGRRASCIACALRLRARRRLESAMPRGSWPAMRRRACSAAADRAIAVRRRLVAPSAPARERRGLHRPSGNPSSPPPRHRPRLQYLARGVVRLRGSTGSDGAPAQQVDHRHPPSPLRCSSPPATGARDPRPLPSALQRTPRPAIAGRATDFLHARSRIGFEPRRDFLDEMLSRTSLLPEGASAAGQLLQAEHLRQRVVEHRGLVGEQRRRARSTGGTADSARAPRPSRAWRAPPGAAVRAGRCRDAWSSVSVGLPAPGDRGRSLLPSTRTLRRWRVVRMMEIAPASRHTREARPSIGRSCRSSAARWPRRSSISLSRCGR